MEQITEILMRIRPDVNFEGEVALIDDGILDSFDVIGIVSELVEAFGITVTVDDIVPENFNSVSAIYEMVQRLEEA